MNVSSATSSSHTTRDINAAEPGVSRVYMENLDEIVNKIETLGIKFFVELYLAKSDEDQAKALQNYRQWKHTCEALHLTSVQNKVKAYESSITRVAIVGSIAAGLTLTAAFVPALSSLSTGATTAITGTLNAGSQAADVTNKALDNKDASQQTGYDYQKDVSKDTVQESSQDVRQKDQLRQQILDKLQRMDQVEQDMMSKLASPAA